MADAKSSPRAKRVWDRLADWYGARFTDQFGTTPLPDWCRVIDATDNASVKRALSIVKAKYQEFPPTFPQFEAALKPVAQTIPDRGPSVAEKLTEWVARKVHPQVILGKMPAWQFSQPWEIRVRESTDDEGRRTSEPVALVIPALGDSPEQRFTVADMQADYDNGYVDSWMASKTCAAAQRQLQLSKVGT